MISELKHQLNISSSRITLLYASEILLQKVLENESESAKYFDVTFAEEWNAFGKFVFEWSLDQQLKYPDKKHWLSYFIYVENANCIIGTCGFKGPPSEEGTVEIGYEISPAYRRKGYAAEAAHALCKFASKHKEINSVIAHTLADDSRSPGVLQKYGFVYSESLLDPEDGEVKRWILVQK